MRVSVGWAVCALAMVFSAQAVAEEAQKGTDSLRRLALEIDGTQQSLGSIRLEGLTTLEAADVWSLIGGRPTEATTFALASDILRRIEGLESFALVDPALEVRGGEADLRIRLEEHPRVTSVALEGLEEVADQALVESLLGLPASGAGSEEAPWLARGTGSLAPGILRGGLEAAISRVMTSLLATGHRMARVRANLTADGALTMQVDEGRIEEVRVAGVTASVESEVLEVLDLAPGRPFLEADVEAGVERVRHAFPFLLPEREVRRSRPFPRVRVSPTQDGGQEATLEEGAPKTEIAVFEVDDGRLTVFFRSKGVLRLGLSIEEILRHSPVAGFGFGVRIPFGVWDPGNRAHLDAELFTASADDEVGETLETDTEERAALVRFRIPRLRIAEVGAQAFALVQTDDQWRVRRPTAYLGSLLFDRPHREFYWSEGSAFFATLQPTRRSLLGVEYREERHRSLVPMAEVPAVFPKKPPSSNPAIDEGQLASLILRAEAQSDAISPADLVGVFRSSQESLVRRPRSFGLRTGFATFATLEISREGLGSDPGRSFSRLVSDSSFFLATDSESGLRLRTRLTVGSSLPRQRQADLGGWGGIRGHDFKEYRGGDGSVLGSVEYRRGWASGFLDIGALHRSGEGWTTPKAGAGLKLHLESLPHVGGLFRRWRRLPNLSLAAAWRLDGRAEAAPALLLQVGHLF